MSSASADNTFVRRGRRLEYLTLGWNSVEAALAIFAGLLAGSIALVGFGLDSVIECSSGAVLLWRLGSGGDAERRERIAVRLVGVSFLLLAAYIAFDAVTSLVQREAPRESYLGIGVAAASLIAMPLLGWAATSAYGAPIRVFGLFMELLGQGAENR